MATYAIKYYLATKHFRKCNIGSVLQLQDNVVLDIEKGKNFNIEKNLFSKFLKVPVEQVVNILKFKSHERIYALKMMLREKNEYYQKSSMTDFLNRHSHSDIKFYLIPTAYCGWEVGSIFATTNKIIFECDVRNGGVISGSIPANWIEITKENKAILIVKRRHKRLQFYNDTLKNKVILSNATVVLSSKSEDSMEISAIKQCTTFPRYCTNSAHGNSNCCIKRMKTYFGQLSIDGKMGYACTGCSLVVLTDDFMLFLEQHRDHLGQFEKANKALFFKTKKVVNINDSVSTNVVAESIVPPLQEHITTTVHKEEWEVSLTEESNSFLNRIIGIVSKKLAESSAEIATLKAERAQFLAQIESLLKEKVELVEKNTEQASIISIQEAEIEKSRLQIEGLEEELGCTNINMAAASDEIMNLQMEVHNLKSGPVVEEEIEIQIV